MRISYHWLSDHISTDLPIEKVSEMLTDTGLEVEGLDEFRSIEDLEGVVLGKVLTCAPHPDADRLKCCKVDVGDEEALDIVCGAPNVAEGQLVPVATVGTQLKTKEGEVFKIKKSKIRGQVSQGMICAEDELGLGEGHDGIMTFNTDLPVGTAIPQVLGSYEDKVIEIGLTPNRTDAICHRGVARDLAAALSRTSPTGLEAKSYEISFPAGNAGIEVKVIAEDGLSRYMGAVLEGITVGPSPEWMQHRLRAIGLSPINNVVDITNYVMHDLGQPLHAFDAERIKGARVEVRRAKNKEAFTTLDGKGIELHQDDLMICDAEAPMCLAGVFGGQDSGVSESTTKIFLEAACFDAVSVRKSAKRHGLSTDSSFRFERGVDANGTPRGLEMAIALLEEHSGAKLVSEAFDHYPVPAEPAIVEYDLDYAQRLIGKDINEFDVASILNSLDIEIQAKNGRTWTLAIPTYRTEVTRPADVVEEVLRIYGFNKIDIPSRWTFSLDEDGRSLGHELRKEMSLWLNGQGCTEMMANSLSNASFEESLGEEHAATAIRLRNPLSQELGVLRQSMRWGMMQAIAHNQNRQSPDLRLYEFGSVYRQKEEGYAERACLSLAITGRRLEEHWQYPEMQSEHHDLAIVLRNAFARVGIDRLHMEETDAAGLERAFTWKSGKHTLGISGLVEQSQLKSFDIRQSVLFAELDWDKLCQLNLEYDFHLEDIPRFPHVRRDLSLLVDTKTTFQQVEECCRNAAGPLLIDFGLFDVYEGKKLPEGKKSYAVSLRFQDPKKTLTDKVVDKAMNRVQQSLEKQLGAQLRA